MSDAGDAVAIERVGLDVSDEMVARIIAFHNAMLAAVHAADGTAAKYRDAQRAPINLVLRRQGEIVGLLESHLAPGWATVRVLETLALAPACRGRGLARRLYDAFVANLGTERRVLLHFRDSGRAQLEPLGPP